MGAGVASSLKQAVTAEGWEQNALGPRLRQLFGAYQIDDCWAAQRRFRNVDDGDGVMSYEELHQVVGLAEFNLLFIWDIFSKQNELMDAREFFTLVCMLSSARLQEKGQFLLAVFDASQSGNCTGAEIGQLCATVFHVLSRLCRHSVKAKDVVAQARREYPTFVPGYQDSAKSRGDNVTFQKERIIGRPELDRMLSSIQGVYDQLPFVGPPPSGAAKPPSTVWSSSNEVGVSRRRSSVIRDADSAALQKLEKKRIETVAKPELAHLSWMDSLDMDMDLGGARGPAAAGGADEAARPESTPAHSWMVIHAVEFASIAKNLAGFRQLFVGSVSSALGLPAECVEVVNITPGSIVVEFFMRPAGRGDGRSASSLVLLLEQQVDNPHSALRRGPLAAYTESAELLAGEPRRAGVLPGRGEGGAPLQSDQAAQTDSAELGTPRLSRAAAKTVHKRDKHGPPPGSEVGTDGQEMAEVAARLREALRELDALRHRASKAEAARATALDQIRWKDSLIEQLRSESASDGR